MSQTLVEHLKAKKASSFEAKDLFSKVVLESSSSCIFGLETEMFREDENSSPLKKHLKNMSDRSGLEMLLLILSLLPGVKTIMGKFGISALKPTETMFFYNVIKNAIEERKKSKLVRNDFIDLLLDAEEKLDNMTIVATAMTFFLAGFDTTSTLLGYACFELARRTDIQDRIKEEIGDAAEKSDDHYDFLNKLKFLEGVILEAGRLHPIAPSIGRVCIEDYELPDGSGIVIKKGESIAVNAIGLHYDEEFYPDPKSFNPDRFMDKLRDNPTCAYLEFGQGPRSCVGMRFAVLLMKSVLAAVLSEFALSPAEDTPMKLEADARSTVGGWKGPLNLRLTQRN